MDTQDAVKRLSALAQDSRLDVFRLLVKAGPKGMAAGDIARKLKTAANTMSAQLLLLSNAQLIRARRDGRSPLRWAPTMRRGGSRRSRTPPTPSLSDTSPTRTPTRSSRGGLVSVTGVLVGSFAWSAWEPPIGPGPPNSSTGGESPIVWS